jgi:hypothetical protein
MAIVDEISEIEKKLTSIKFAKSGCIYFRKDIPNSEPLQTNPPLSSQILNCFTMGPLVSNEFWSGQKARMDLNRGPCKTAFHFSISGANKLKMKNPSNLSKRLHTMQENL